MRRVRIAVIPAAGLGSRMLPATKAIPKALLPVVDKPVIHYIVEEAVASGIELVVIVVGRGQYAIADYFDRLPELEHRLCEAEQCAEYDAVAALSSRVEIAIVHQPEPLGNGHAVWCAHDVVGTEPFAMLWGDGIVLGVRPALAQFLDVYGRTGASVLGVKRVPAGEVDRYGIIDGNPIDAQTLRVRAIVEKPPVGQAPSNLAQVKGCVFTNRLMAVLKDTPPKHNGEIWLVDAIRILLAEEPIYAHVVEGLHVDTGNPLEWIQANIEFALRRDDLRIALLPYLQELAATWQGCQPWRGQAALS